MSAAERAFVVDIDGYEGPIDVLLTLARDQKVDLTQISIVQLADQYLAFVARVRGADLDLAAEYLVMAAWLAYLKSRLLLPDLAPGEEPTAAAMAAALAFKLRRLEAMQDAGARLMARGRLGQDVFARGAAEDVEAGATETVVKVGLYDLLKAYADQRRKKAPQPLTFESWELYSVEDALERLGRSLGRAGDWQSLWSMLPPGTVESFERGGLAARSAVAATFTASLELTREGRARLRQSAPFGPIYVRGADEAATGE